MTYEDATNELCTSNFFDDSVIYEKRMDIEDFYKRKKENVWVDEGYLVGDKREIVRAQENKLIHYSNIFASNLNRTHILIQNYQHIDFRLRDKATLDKYYFRRGDVFAFSEFKTAMLQNQDHFDVENQERFIFANPKSFVNFLLRREGFIKRLRPPQLWTGSESDFNPQLDKVDPLYITYLDWKKEHQGRLA